MTTTITLNVGQTNWTVPSDWTSVNTISCLGPGGNGQNGSVVNIPFDGSANVGGVGGGGSAYAQIINQTLTSGMMIPIQIGLAGSQNDTWWNTTATVRGQAGQNGVSGGAAGQASSSVGATTTSGTNGGAGGFGQPGGAGGAPGAVISSYGEGGSGGNGPYGGGSIGTDGVIIITYTPGASGAGSRREQTMVASG